MLESIGRELGEKLKKQPISSRVLLDRLRLLDDVSRKSSQYQDPAYLPFYYYLSKLVSPKSILNVGLDLGLPICCFLKGCPTVERLLAFQKTSKYFYSPRIAVSNISDIKPSGLLLDYYRGEIIDEALEPKMSKGFDLVLICSPFGCDEMNDILDVCWRFMNLDAFMVVDYVRSNPKAGDMFKSFCKVKNRDFILLDTRYGNAVVQK